MTASHLHKWDRDTGSVEGATGLPVRLHKAEQRFKLHVMIARGQDQMSDLKTGNWKEGEFGSISGLTIELSRAGDRPVAKRLFALRRRPE